MKMSPERQGVLRALESASEPLSPSAVAAALGREASPGSVRKLMAAMREDGQIVERVGGVYELPEVHVTDEDPSQALAVTVTDGVADGELTAVTDNEEIGESGVDMPHPTYSPSGMYAYSERDGGAIHVELLRWRKGYR